MAVTHRPSIYAIFGNAPVLVLAMLGACVVVLFG
jgi:hypothetical protein